MRNKSNRTVQDYLNVLEKKGYIKIRAGTEKGGGIKVLCIENAYSHNTSLRVPQAKGNRLNKH